MNKKPKIAIFGGGTGLSVLLRGLKHKPVDITAIVTVADDGGSWPVRYECHPAAEFEVHPADGLNFRRHQQLSQSP